MYPPSEGVVEEPYVLLVHQSSPSAISTRVLLKELRSSIEEYFGSYGSGITGGNLVLKYFSNSTSTGIVRCGREQYRVVCAALQMISVIEGINVVVRVVKVSGTIKKSEIFAVKRNKELMLQTKGVVVDELNLTDDE